jgi:maleamate amidohydrolase
MIERDWKADYRGAGFLGEIGFGRRPALVIIDAVRAYLDRDSPLYAGIEDAIDGMARLLSVARERRIPIIFTRQEFERDGVDGGVYRRKVPVLNLLKPGSVLAEIVPALAPGPGEIVILKRYPSAFFHTDLDAHLKAARVDTLLIAGLTTSGCVRATAMDTMLAGYAGMVVRQAVGDRSVAQHEANLFDIAAKLSDVRGEAEVISWLRGLPPN